MDRPFRVGDWLVEPQLGTISDGKQATHLEPKVMQVLVCLAERAPEVMAKEPLVQAVWPQTFVTDDALMHAISELRRAFGDDARAPRYIQTIPKRGYRLIARVTFDGHAARDVPPPVVAAAQPTRQHARVYWSAAGALILAVFALAGMFQHPPALTDQDTVLLADFINTTGDPVFDDALETALAVRLEESPFLNILSDERVREALRLMEHSPDAPVTVAVAREICERQNLKALLYGSIAPLGRHYVIALEAVNGHTGETIAREQVEAESKEQVLKALGRAAGRLRGRLGEALPLIPRFDTPIEQATTSSLAIPFLKRAVELRAECRPCACGVR